MQDLYAERMKLFDRLMDELQALRNSGSQYAENEAEYRKALRTAILEERSKGTPVTVISDLCRGREDIAELKQRRDCSEALYKASQEAINVFKLKIRTVDEDMKRIDTTIAEGNGKVDNVDEWGKRKLAYEINDLTEGDYTLIKFHADPTQIAELDRVMRITDAVIRHMIVRRDDQE